MRLRRSDLLYRLVSFIGDLSFRCVYRLRIEGRENLPARGPAVLLPKHQFWTDIPIVGIAARKPMNYIAKQELFVYPGIKHFLTLLGGVPIDRLKPVRSLDTFRYVDELLAHGEFIVLFPEGTYYPEVMGRGKYRFIQSMLRFQEKRGQPIPFIPMGIRYLKGIRRPEVRVRIGQPLYAAAESEAQELTQRIIQEIARLSEIPIHHRGTENTEVYSAERP